MKKISGVLLLFCIGAIFVNANEKTSHEPAVHVVKPKTEKHTISSAEPKTTRPTDSLKKLMDGNKRYVSGKVKHPNEDSKRREEVAKGQHPFAIVLTCSDSRVPPEIIFDQGIGDLFVVRTAGNIVDDVALGSIEYAVEHLGSKLILVMGHEKCGAVDATVKGGEAPGHIAKIVETIKPAVEQAKHEEGDLLENAIISNIEMIVHQLKTSEPILAEFVEKNEIRVMGARYDLDSGEVTTVAAN